MDWNSIHKQFAPFRIVSKRISQLSSTLEARYRHLASSAAVGSFKHARIIRAAMLGFLSLTCGLWAYGTCREETTLEWKKSHYPSLQIWTFALESEGFHPVGAKELAHALKALPSRVEFGNQIWEGQINSGPSWWAIYSGNEGDPILLCRDCQKPPQTWIPAGEGWDGFDQVMTRVHEQAHLPVQNGLKASKRKEIFDPREIRY
jgi:hypothetical protein